MAEKKPRRRDLVAKLKGLPDVSSAESQDFPNEDEIFLRAWQEERSFRSSMKETPFADRLVDSRHDLVIGDRDVLSINSSLRFNVGNGFVLDYSVLHNVLSPEFAVSLLETILPLVPLMKDGIEIEVDNHEPGFPFDEACDGFKNRPPGNTPQHSDTWLFESSREKVDEFDDMPVYRICYCYDHLDAFEVESTDSTFSEHVFYSVKYGDIHVLFPSSPDQADLEWVSGIRSCLESLAQLLSREKGCGYLPHFILWRDDHESTSNNTI